MIGRANAWWASRAPRERALLATLAIVVGVGIYASFVQTAMRARAQLGNSVAELRLQADRLEEYAAELERARAAPAPPPPGTDLRAAIQSQAAQAGLAQALVRVEALDAGQATAEFGAVAFADWLKLVQDLDAQRIRITACRIEALSTPGMVSVAATLARPQPQ